METPKINKLLTFQEFVARWISDSPKRITKTSLIRAEKFIQDCSTQSYHEGDCTDDSVPCALCALERVLAGYYEYCKNKGQVK